MILKAKTLLYDIARPIFFKEETLEDMRLCLPPYFYSENLFRIFVGIEARVSARR